MEAESCTPAFNITGGFSLIFQIFCNYYFTAFGYAIYCLRLSIMKRNLIPRRLCTVRMQTFVDSYRLIKIMIIVMKMSILMFMMMMMISRKKNI